MADSIKVEKRENFGKGASRQLRRDGRTPGVVYGLDSEPTHVSFDAHEIYMEVRANANALLTLELEGKKQLALVKDVQRNPLSRIIEHIDLLRVRADQKVEVEVPVILEGEPFGDAIASIETQNVLVEAPATEIPESIVVDVEGKEDGTQILVSDLVLPENVTAVLDAEEIIVVVAVPQLEELPEEGAEEAEGEGEAAEAPAEGDAE